MKIRSLFLTLFCGICFSVSAQVDTFQQCIIEYLNNNGTDAQYGQTYDEIFDVLKNQFEVPEKVWSELKEDKAESIQDAIAFLSFAYRKHFTEVEVTDMATFYKTEAAQKMISKDSNLSEDDTEQINAFFNSDLGKKIDAKREALSVDTDEISRQWSRDLFAEKMGVLVKKGYSTK